MLLPHILISELIFTVRSMLRIVDVKKVDIAKMGARLLI